MNNTSRIAVLESAERELFQLASAQMPDLMALCEQYFAVFDSFCDVIDVEKFAENKDKEQAFNNCLRNIEKCFSSTALAILRGDPLNSYASSRKAIESCAFAFLILDEPTAGAAYVQAFVKEAPIPISNCSASIMSCRKGTKML